VTLRRWFIAYILGVHLLVAGLGAYALREQMAWFLAVEAGLVVSLAVGLLLTRALFAGFSFVGEAPRFLDEGDFMSRFREVGQPEVDSLIRLYNRMSDDLRNERVRLQEQQHFLAKVLAVSPLGIVLLDFDGGVSYVNPSAERLLERQAGQVVGRPLAGRGGPQAEARDRLQVDASTIVPLVGGRRVRCQHGSFYDRGFARSFLVVEELTEELRQFEKAAYGKLIRVMSHEVNNSVGASNSLLHSCLAYAPALPPEHRADFESALSIAIARTDQLNAFMRSFADVIRLPDPHLQPCDVGEVLAEIGGLVRAQCEERRIEWRTVAESPPAIVAMDRVQMEQVFLNVVKNAIDAIGRDGVITLRLTRRDGGHPVVEIEDTGPGLAPEARQNLFTPFFSTKENGQGIGLTLVQEVLGRHHFGYALDSPPGGPTRFTITF
jgi:two-component system, NtrC family, nitrogen regulation sensor histidine kinase NtrY